METSVAGGTNSSMMETFPAAAFRHRKLLACLFLGTVALAILYSLVVKKQYQSSMKVAVQSTRAIETVSPDSTAIPQTDQASSQDLIDARLNSEIELLTNNDLLEHLVLYRAHLLPDIAAPEPGSREMAKQVKSFTKRLDVEPVRKSNVIAISYNDLTPEVAQRVLQELQRTYLEKHVRLQRPAGTFQFFQNEASADNTRLADLENQLAEFRKENQIVSLENEKAMLSTDLNTLNVAMDQDQTDLKSATMQLQELKNRLRATPARISTQVRTGPNQMGSQTLASLLVDLTNKRTQLLTRYRPTDRLVTEVDAQMMTTKREIDELARPAVLDSAMDNNPTWLALDGQLQAQQVARAAAEGRLRAHKANAEAYRLRLAQLQALTPRNNELERQVDDLKEMQHTVAEKRNSAKIGDLLDTQRFGNVAVALDPTYSRQHVKPKLLLNAALGVVTGLFLCVAAIMLLEFTRKTVLTPAELEAFCGIPVLATIAEVPGIDRLSIQTTALPLHGEAVARRYSRLRRQA